MELERTGIPARERAGEAGREPETAHVGRGLLGEDGQRALRLGSRHSGRLGGPRREGDECRRTPRRRGRRGMVKGFPVAIDPPGPGADRAREPFRDGESAGVPFDRDRVPSGGFPRQTRERAEGMEGDDRGARSPPGGGGFGRQSAGEVEREARMEARRGEPCRLGRDRVVGNRDDDDVGGGSATGRPRRKPSDREPHRRERTGEGSSRPAASSDRDPRPESPGARTRLRGVESHGLFLNLAPRRGECLAVSESTGGIDERAREVLKEIIRLHAETGRPVSSRALAKQKKFHASPATIRNMMADLTDAGYLRQPHTSAGRVPTEKAYRHYVRTLMPKKEVPAGQREIVSLDLSGAGHDPSVLYPAVSRLLSKLSGEVGVVVAPDARRSVVREIRFVPIGREKALAVQVGDGDVVFTRLIETGGRLDAAALEKAGTYLTAEFGGATLVAIRNRVTLAMQEERARFDNVLFETLDLARRAILPAEHADIYTDGTRRLLERPEFAEPESLKRVYRAFEEKANLVELLDQCLEGEGPRIVIGSESHLTAGKPISAVVTRYGGENRPPGVLGIVGSLRMSYPRIVPLVEFLGRALSEKLDEPTDGSADGSAEGSPEGGDGPDGGRSA